MPVVAIINRKGGCGKSTLATQLAGYLATRGLRVMLGDVDRQQSSLSWLRRRGAQAAGSVAEIVGWAIDVAHVKRPPVGITHAVLDTPGGLHGLDLARVVMHADIVLLPVQDGCFDLEAAALCIEELMALPRVAQGRCKLGLVGVRVNARDGRWVELAEWSKAQQLPLLGVLKDSASYARCAAQGLTLFDLPAAKVRSDLAQWQAITAWLDKALAPAAPATMAAGHSRPCHVGAPAVPAKADRPDAALPWAESGYASKRAAHRSAGAWRSSTLSREPKPAPARSGLSRWFTALRSVA
jgi:chromosome partitioning protein